MTTTEAVRLIAQYDGWVRLSPHSVEKAELYENEQSMQWLHRMPYLINLNELHRVALGAMEGLKVYIKKSEKRDIYTAADDLATDIILGFLKHPVANEYTDLLLAVARGIEFINQNKTA